MGLVDRRPPTRAEYDAWREKPSNWGRRGADGELGTVNFVRPEVRCAAAGLVAAGRSVPLARPIDTRAGPRNPFPAHHFIPAGSSGGLVDYVGMFIHGFSQTHLDALSHIPTADGACRCTHGSSRTPPRVRASRRARAPGVPARRGAARDSRRYGLAGEPDRAALGEGGEMASHEDALMRLRQVAFVASELEPVVDALCDVLGIEVAYRDPGVGVFGLRNAVMALGDTFLEVVSPDRPGTTAGRLLERRGGDGGYMVIVQSQAREADRKRALSQGVRIVWEATQDDAATIHLHPRDVGGAILSLDWMDPPDSWRWAGPRWRDHVRTDVVSGIAGVAIQASDPAAMARRWSEVLAQPARIAAGSATIALPDGGAIRFVPERDGRGEGVSGLIVAAADPERARVRAQERGALRSDGAIELCGVRIELAPVGAAA